MVRYTNREHLESTWQKVARILADKFDISVHFEGSKAYTDGKRIVLPQIPEGLPKELIQVGQGFLDHEVGHHLWTDWEVLKRIIDPVTRHFAEMCEDIRQEGRTSDMWRGSEDNLEYKRRWAIRNVQFPNWHERNGVDRLWVGVYLKACDDKELLDEFPDKEMLELLEPIMPALKMIRGLESTSYAAAMGSYLMEALGLEPEIPELPPEVEEALQHLKEMIESAEEPKSEEGEGEPKEGESEPEEGEQEEEPEESQGTPEEGEEEGEEEEEPEEGESKESTPMPSLGSLGSLGEGEIEGEEEEESESEEEAEEEESIAEILEIPSGEQGTIDPSLGLEKAFSEQVKQHQREASFGTNWYRPYSTANDEILVMPSGDRAWFQQQITEARKTSGVMMRQLRMCIATIAKRKILRGQEEGELHSPDIPKFLVEGNSRIFRRFTRGESTDAMVALLLDASGSMRGRKQEAARQGAIVMGEFCNSLKIPFEIYAFTSKDFSSASVRWGKATESEQNMFSRWGDMRFEIYKQFNEDWRRTGHRLEHYESQCHNYDGEALLIAAKRLLRSRRKRETRLILFVLSDGYPEQSIGAYRSHIRWHLRDAIKQVRKAGVELFAMGMDSDAVKKYYPNSVDFDNPYEMNTLQLNAMREFFLKGKKKKRKAAS